MKTLLSPAQEVEYDFILEYKDGMPCPLKLHGEVPSPVVHSGGVHEHPGPAYVVAESVEQDRGSSRVQKIYVKQFRTIQ